MFERSRYMRSFWIVSVFRSGGCADFGCALAVVANAVSKRRRQQLIRVRCFMLALYMIKKSVTKRTKNRRTLTRLESARHTYEVSECLRCRHGIHPDPF